MATPTVTIRMPEGLKTTAGERNTLKSAFRSKLVGVLRHHQATSNDIWNVGSPVNTDVIVIAGSGGSARGSKRKTSKKAAKKK